MSKSYGNTIDIFADKNSMKKKVMSIVTDCTPLEDPKDPSSCNVFALYSLFASKDEKSEMEDMYRKGGFGYGTAKKMLLEKINAHFEPYRQKRAELQKDISTVKNILFEGAVKAQTIAQETIEKVRSVVGVTL
jgi:tryptophanyl-tRNA synthetase